MGILDWFSRKSGPPDLTLEQFAKLLMAAVRERGYRGKIRLDLERSRLRFRDLEEHAVVHEMFLGNAYDEYLAADAEERPEVLARYAMITSGSSAIEDLRARILPKATPRRDRELLTGHGADVVIRNLTTGRRIGDTLYLELAVDESARVRGVTAADLEASGLTEDTAFEIAIENLRARSRQPWTRLGPGLFQSPWADYFDGARLAIPELFRDLDLRGDPVVVVPNRCAVLVSGTDEPEGLASMYAAALNLMKIDRPIDLTPFRLDGERWLPIGPDDRDVFERAVNLTFLWSIQSMLDHDLLQVRLEPELHARGLTLVRLRTLQPEHGPLITVANLPTTSGLAVPVADLFEYIRDGQRHVMAWYKLAALLGDDLVAIDDIWPLHYEVRRALSQSEISASKSM